jgi:hypothetical protein
LRQSVQQSIVCNLLSLYGWILDEVEGLDMQELCFKNKVRARLKLTCLKIKEVTVTETL